MAEIETQKMKVANQMAQGSQPRPSMNYQDYLTNGQWDDSKFTNAFGTIDINDPNNDTVKTYDRLQNDWLYQGTGASADAARAGSRITPQMLMQNQMDREASSYEANLDQTKAKSANLLTAQADQTLNQGLHNVRSDANKRGLLYSNIRSGNEADLRGRVSSLLARQISESNADFDNSANARKYSAAEAKLNSASAALERQAQVDAIRQQNDVSRAQQMQQLASIAGYAAGSLMSGSKSQNSPDRMSTGGNRYISSDVAG